MAGQKMALKTEKREETVESGTVPITETRPAPCGIREGTLRKGTSGHTEYKNNPKEKMRMTINRNRIQTIEVGTDGKTTPTDAPTQREGPEPQPGASGGRRAGV